MKYTAAKTVTIALMGQSRINLPDIQELRGKRIQAINAVIGVKPLDGSSAVNDSASLSLSLTDNGVDYFFSAVPMQRFDSAVCRGINLPIDRALQLRDCFISNPEKLTDSLVLVVFYENRAFSSSPTSPFVAIDNVEVLLRSESPFKQFLPDNRTMYGAAIRGIRATFPELTPNGNPGVENAETNCYLTLMRGTTAVLDAVPVALLNQTDWFAQMEFDDIHFDFDNSFVELAEVIDENRYLLLTFDYERK